MIHACKFIATDLEGQNTKTSNSVIWGQGMGLVISAMFSFFPSGTYSCTSSKIKNSN